MTELLERLLVPDQIVKESLFVQKVGVVAWMLARQIGGASFVRNIVVSHDVSYLCVTPNRKPSLENTAFPNERLERIVK